MKYFGPEQRGSAANQVASRNPYGQYYRERVQPDQTATARRTAAKAHMSTIAAAWGGTLTADQRQAWRGFSAELMRIDTLGQRQRLTGFSAFCRYNLFTFANVAAVVQPDPPAGVDPFGDLPQSTGVWQSSPYVGTEFTWVNRTSHNRFEWFQSARPVSAGTGFFPGRGNWWRRTWGTQTNDSPTFVEVDGIGHGQRVALRWRELAGLVVPGPWNEIALVRP